MDLRRRGESGEARSRLGCGVLGILWRISMSEGRGCWMCGVAWDGMRGRGFFLRRKIGGLALEVGLGRRLVGQTDWSLGWAGLG